MNVLHTHASQVAALDVGYSSNVKEVKEQQPNVLFLLGADDANVKREDFPNTLIVYIGMYRLLPRSLACFNKRSCASLSISVNFS